MKPICVKCKRFFRMKRSGTHFLEGMPVPNSAKPGNAEPENWKPYKLWAGDLWECPDCGAQIISGVGRDRIAEHYQPDFEERVKSYDAKFQVNDC